MIISTTESRRLRVRTVVYGYSARELTARLHFRNMTNSALPGDNTEDVRAQNTDNPADRFSMCPFCREASHPSAMKCPHCHEFLPSEGKKKNDGETTRLFSSVLDLVGKTFIPATILALAFGFKPTFESLLTRTSQAEFLGTKLVFSQTAAFKGSLTPYELYYLIGSAGNYGRQGHGGFNLDMLKRNGHDKDVYALQEKGLVRTEIVENTKNPEIFGKESIELIPTEKGKQFLIELGLVFDGRVFVSAE